MNKNLYFFLFLVISPIFTTTSQKQDVNVKNSEKIHLELKDEITKLLDEKVNTRSTTYIADLLIAYSEASEKFNKKENKK